jgi:hypothetical protein
MIERLKSRTAVATIASLVAALGVGGVALAQNSGSSTPAQNASPAAAKVAPAKKAAEAPGQESNAPDNSAQDTDSVQAGDQSGGGDQSGEDSGSEVPGNDGPGGHADEPGNANADHQETGQE